MKKKILLWLKAIRAPFFSATIMSAVVGSSLAFKDSSFNWLYLLLSIIIIAGTNCGINLVNDYYDHKNKADDINMLYTPFSGGSRVIQDKQLKPSRVLAAGIASFALVAILGIILSIVANIYLLWFGLAGIALGFFYSANPFRLVYRGWGEAVIFLLVGPVSVIGTYFLQTSSITLESILVSIPVGFLTANILLINEFPDYASDKQAGKNQLVVIIGRKKARYIYLALTAAIYVSVIIPVILSLLSPFLLVVLLGIPLAVWASYTAFKYHSNPEKILPAQANTILLTLISTALISLGLILQKLVYPL
ncbi:MAG: 1,4-dihydroxy-2-naphthoate octaprenyltransferase [Actinomycetota bacterium]|jgi:1,4-dihydroxy-2-naphthoate octaprenyltransferase|nr:1,4-dihydroxy-2-naphthoate octaprenyltransferase [Actinomycetota bacterium]